VLPFAAPEVFDALADAPAAKGGEGGGEAGMRRTTGAERLATGVPREREAMPAPVRAEGESKGLAAKPAGRRAVPR
jgi:hypothetical protein